MNRQLRLASSNSQNLIHQEVVIVIRQVLLHQISTAAIPLFGKERTFFNQRTFGHSAVVRLGHLRRRRRVARGDEAGDRRIEEMK